MLTNSLYCAICSAPFELPTICDHEDSFHKNPPDDDVSFNICFGMGYDSRKLSYQETEWLLLLRVMGKCDSNFVNCSNSPQLYISDRAFWERREYGESNMPLVPDRRGRLIELQVYDYPPHGVDDMLVPVHEACLAILGRLCTIRQQQQTRHALGSSKPDTPERFCVAFAECRRRNLDTPGFIVGYEGGLEWPHQAYGATRYWSDGWDCERGGEIFCAAPMLPGDHLPLATVGETTPLACYVNSDIAAHDYPGPSHDELDVPYSGPDDAKIDVNSGAPAVPRDHLQRTTVGGKTSLACHANSDTSPLDYPTPDDTELDMNGARSHETLGPLSYPSSNAASSFSSQSEGPPHDEWEKQIQAWIREADDSHDPTGILEEATKHLANAPLRIQNRWRIFKILLLV